jgi:lipopolysaccharide transport system ATP-binding protein
MEPIIVVKNISKKYKINHERGGYISLRDVVMNVLKRPFSYLKHKAKSVAGLEKKEDFWALKDVNFTVNKGEVIGIIGRNGAGKSTLLKILTQITEPTEGEITMRGTVGSLLEVGTGFHPELTGRENIFLNGAILGMGKKEIVSKFDKIVEFAGIEKFLDTPVKHYSSGMYVRLAFSVAAHMEPDILLIDEVLAVGDAEFQKKCLGKMEEVTKKDGRTILFVSHNMSAIRSLCEKVILLEKGSIAKVGHVDEVLDYYLNITKKEKKVELASWPESFHIKDLQFMNEKEEAWTIDYHEDLKMEVTLENSKPYPGFILGMGINTMSGERVTTIHSDPIDLEKGTYKIRLNVQNLFTPGAYEINIGVLNRLHIPSVVTFLVTNKNDSIPSADLHKPYNFGFVDVNSKIQFIKT